MPRGVRVTRVLPNLTKAARAPHSEPTFKGPRLYNGHRRVKSAIGIQSTQATAELERDPLSQAWRSEVSKDVEQFVDDMEAQGTKLLPEEQRQLLRGPAHYFSRPQNVPVNLRQQVYFPDFSITMRRQNTYGPYYAQFEVPLWFSKLDLKGYLKQVYNVDVVHIRSYTLPGLVSRKSGSSPYTQGALFRTPSEKRMLAQLVEPFEWPVKPKDVDKALFDTDGFWDTAKVQSDETRRTSDMEHKLIDKQHRKAMADQAQAILEGKDKWAPTWKSLPNKAKLAKDLAEPVRGTDNVLLGKIKRSEATKGRTIRVL